MEKIFDLDKILSKLNEAGNYYYEFFSLEKLQVGLLRLQPFEKDVQSVHSWNEIYYVIRGDGFSLLNNKKHKLKINSFIYVPANMEHRFMDNTEELLVAYFLIDTD